MRTGAPGHMLRQQSHTVRIQAGLSSLQQMSERLVICILLLTRRVHHQLLCLFVPAIDHLLQRERDRVNSGLRSNRDDLDVGSVKGFEVHSR